MGVVSSPPAFLQLFKMAAGVVGAVVAAFKGVNPFILKKYQILFHVRDEMFCSRI
jgi:hypothetical protein